MAGSGIFSVVMNFLTLRIVNPDDLQPHILDPKDNTKYFDPDEMKNVPKLFYV